MKRRGLGMVFQRGSTWWVQYHWRGKRYRETSGSLNRSDAVKLLRKRFAEMGRGSGPATDMERTTLEGLFKQVQDDYVMNGRRSMRRLCASVKHLRAFFGPGYRAHDITLDRLTAYVAARLDAGKKPATVKNELIALHRAFHLAERSGKAICPPFPQITVQNTRSGFFEREDFLAVRNHLPQSDQGVSTFAYLTGWRTPSEILTLQWRQVDFTAGTVRLEPGTTKNAEGRTFPFAVLPELTELLHTQWARTMEHQVKTGTLIPWVFHRNGKRIHEKAFMRAWHRACNLAGLTGRTPHDFRRTAVRNLERAGVPRSVAMKLTGHKTEAVYRRYAIVSEADLSDGLKKLARLHVAERTKQAPSSLATEQPQCGHITPALIGKEPRNQRVVGQNVAVCPVLS